MESPYGPHIEALLRKAHVDPGFKQRLIATRGDVARELGIVLDTAEASMLRSIDVAQLEAVIEAAQPPEGAEDALAGNDGAAILEFSEPPVPRNSPLPGGSFADHVARYGPIDDGRRTRRIVLLVAIVVAAAAAAYFLMK